MHFSHEEDGGVSRRGRCVKILRTEFTTGNGYTHPFFVGIGLDRRHRVGIPGGLSKRTIVGPGLAQLDPDESLTTTDTHIASRSSSISQHLRTTKEISDTE